MQSNILRLNALPMRVLISYSQPLVLAGSRIYPRVQLNPLLFLFVRYSVSFVLVFSEGKVMITA